MKRLLSCLFIIAGVAILVVAVAAWGKPAGKHHRGGKTITVIEHATTDATTDTGAAGDSAGDVLTFANEVFDRKDENKVGTDQGYCIRVVAGASYECNYTTLLAGGQIVVEGPFYDTKDSVLAITGGTGRYRNARGAMELQSLENGTKFRFVFHIIG
jgi:Allene oxide cyclase barrel like domain